MQLVPISKSWRWAPRRTRSGPERASELRDLSKGGRESVGEAGLGDLVTWIAVSMVKVNGGCSPSASPGFPFFELSIVSNVVSQAVSVMGEEFYVDNAA